MPKDNRLIHSGVRFGGKVYTDVDELDEVGLSQSELDSLTERGAISGDWKAGKKAEAVEAVEAVEEVEEAEEAEEAEAVDLESLTVAELKALAEERGVELTGTKKADIIAELRGAE